MSSDGDLEDTPTSAQRLKDSSDSDPDYIPTASQFCDEWSDIDSDPDKVPLDCSALDSDMDDVFVDGLGTSDASSSKFDFGIGNLIPFTQN
ncbi:MAG: hypothetical protein GY774_03785 [Planctomycetes bacterium]|nr:hypothetical protein [Planctomycetota bacterium]